MLDAAHIIGQILFGGFFVYSGIKHFVQYKNYTAYTASKKVPAPGLAVIVSGLLLVLGGFGVFFHIYLMASLILLIVFLIPTTLVMHAFWSDTDAQTKAVNVIQFGKNLALLGAVLLMF